MKKQAILAAMLAAISGASFAAGFDLNYTGDVTHVGCVIDPATASVTVPLVEKTLADVNGSTARIYEPFSFNLKNCGPNQVVRGVFTTPNTLNGGKNKFLATGTGTGIGMVVRYAAQPGGAMTAAIFNATPVGIATNKSAIANDVKVNMDLLVVYFTSIGTAVAGTASGSMSVTLSY